MDKNYKTIAVVQARMGSKRLPGKSMMELLPGMSLIKMVLMRIKRSRKTDLVVLATSKNKDCDPLVKIADELNVKVIRGDENDVLSRFVTAVDKFKPENIVRICADNPFVSPEEIDKLIDFFHDRKLDYASNNNPGQCGLPDGFGAEIIKAKQIPGIWSGATPAQKEHVTKYYFDKQEDFQIAYLKAEKDLIYPGIKLDIDNREDFNKISALLTRLDKIKSPYWNCNEIIDAFQKEMR